MNDFGIISISTDAKEKIKAWQNAIKCFSLTWALYLDMGAKSLNINFYPFNYLFDSEGVILNKNLTMGQLKEVLKRH